MITELQLEVQQPPRPAPAPARGKLPEGYHYTEKYGEVFVSPGRIAWTIKEMPDGELKSVSVTLTSSDIIKTPAVERLKHAKEVQRSRNRSKGLTQPSNFVSGKRQGGKQGLLGTIK